MSETPSTSGGVDSDTTFDEGRYLYCAVSIDGSSDFETAGIEDTPVSVVTADGVGVVVQTVDSLYDSDDPAQVRRWVLSHQRVVDDAGEAFGTPLPFRFDTILRGDDSVVAEWIDERRADVETALAYLEGRWEYRIGIRRSRSSARQVALESDEELQALADRVEDASEGTGYLLESQFDQRLDERIRRRNEAIADGVIERLEPHAVDVRRSNGGSGRFSDGGSDADRSSMETVVRLSILADRGREERIGQELDSFAADPAFDVSYTGPWPPYTFAPAVGPGGDPEA